MKLLHEGEGSKKSTSCTNKRHSEAHWRSPNNWFDGLHVSHLKEGVHPLALSDKLLLDVQKIFLVRKGSTCRYLCKCTHIVGLQTNDSATGQVLEVIPIQTEVTRSVSVSRSVGTAPKGKAPA